MTIKRKKSRDVERAVTRHVFIRNLRRLADALEADKSYVIQVRGERIRIPKEAALSIEHEREGGEEEIEFQIRFSRK